VSHLPLLEAKLPPLLLLLLVVVVARTTEAAGCKPAKDSHSVAWSLPLRTATREGQPLGSVVAAASASLFGLLLPPPPAVGNAGSWSTTQKSRRHSACCLATAALQSSSFEGRSSGSLQRPHTPGQGEFLRQLH